MYDIIKIMMYIVRFLPLGGFTNHYTSNEQTPKAVCTLNSKGEKKEEKEEGERKEGRDDERATLIERP
jgi:hypothetical protein